MVCEFQATLADFVPYHTRILIKKYTPPPGGGGGKWYKNYKNHFPVLIIINNNKIGFISVPVTGA